MTVEGRPIGRHWLRAAAIRALIDAILLAAAMALAFWLRFEGAVPTWLIPILWRTILLSLAMKIPVLLAFRAHRIQWHLVGLGDLVATSMASIVGTSMLAALVYVLQGTSPWGGVPRSILGIDMAFSTLALVGIRLSRRVLLHAFSGLRSRGTRALVIGAGEAGATLLRALESDPAYAVVGILDDDPSKWGLRIRGVPVIGPRDQMAHQSRRHRTSSVLIALPLATPAVIRETIELAREAEIPDIKIVPQLSELYTGRISSEELRDVRPEDMLVRQPVRVDEPLIEKHLAGRTVLVTGAAGSIGTELCRQCLRFGAKRVVAVDFNETALFYLESDLRDMFPDREVSVVITNVRDGAKVQSIVSEAAPQIVYHAAAYKHVPLMEAFPAEAVETNVFGTRNVLTAACDAGCDSFVMISTDKAVNPTSVMGATKRIAEIIVRSHSSETVTKCVAVRFGNVLGSRGSVLRTFQEQIKQRRPVTVTDPQMTRYFMVTSEAVQLVLQAGVVGQSGQVLVLDMGEPVKIVDLARDMIRFYGLKPDVDVPIVYTGTRPGEKLCEELLTAEEGTEATAYDKVFVSRLSMERDATALTENLSRLRVAAGCGSRESLIHVLSDLVPSYSPSASPATPCESSDRSE